MAAATPSVAGTHPVQGNGPAAAGEADEARASGPEYSALLNAHTDSDRVARLLLAVLRRLCPPALLGGAHNEAVLAAAVHRLVALRRFESVTRTACMQGLRASHMRWLWPRSPPRARVPLQQAQRAADDAATLAWWLVAQVAVPLVRALFYATEGSAAKNRIFFYRCAGRRRSV
jgi:hypothetical protein